MTTLVRSLMHVYLMYQIVFVTKNSENISKVRQ